MKIAVLMSTYNGEKYLDKQLESIANQTIAKCVTIYIRDDGSVDRTLEIAENWKNRIKIQIYIETNVGPAKSFWELLQKDIVADYYAFCDQDDIWDSHKLENAIMYLNGDTHLYASNCRIIDSAEKVIKEKFKSQFPVITIPTLFVSGCTQGCSMVFTKELKEYVVNKNINCIPMHDIVLMLYALKFGSIFWDVEPRFSYRVHENNVVSKTNKSIIKKLKTTYWNWKNSSKNSMADVAREMYYNIDNLSEEEKEYLLRVINYKKSIINKMKLVADKNIRGASPSLLRSYRIRILIGLF